MYFVAVVVVFVACVDVREVVLCTGEVPGSNPSKGDND